MSTKTFSKTFEHSRQFQTILAKVQSLQALQEILVGILPPEMTSHCHVANFQDGKLMLQVDSSAFAMRLRYLLPSLVPKLRPQLNTLKQVDFFIQPQNDAPAKTAAPTLTTSPQAAAVIRDLADSLTKTDPLYGALQRLATSLERPHR